MSRLYEMTVTVTGFDKKRKDEVIDACREEWEFNDDAFDCAEGDSIEMTGQSNLCGGESEEEFADRLAAAVWTANKQYCKVEVRATYMENLPCEEHVREEASYEKWQRKGKGKKR